MTRWEAIKNTGRDALVKIIILIAMLLMVLVASFILGKIVEFVIVRLGYSFYDPAIDTVTLGILTLIIMNLILNLIVLPIRDLVNKYKFYRNRR